jgi:hypothetical protein
MPAAFVQSKSLRDLTDLSVFSLAFDTNVTAGSVVCGFVFWNPSGVTLNSVGDGTRTFTLLDNPTTVGGGASAAMFYYENHPGGATTVTVTFSGVITTSMTLIIHEASGCLTSSALDQHIINPQTAPGTGADAVTSTSVTTTGNGEYCAGFMVERSGGGAITKGSDPWVQREHLAIVGMSEDQIQTSAGGIAATFTLGTSDQTLTGIMTFKAATTGPTVAQEIPAILQALIGGVIIGRADA